jgi:hypothetical protein
MERGANGEKPFSDFYVKAQKALAESGLRNQAVITKCAVAGDWRAAAYNRSAISQRNTATPR